MADESNASLSSFSPRKKFPSLDISHPTKILWVRWGLPIATGVAVALVTLALLSLFGHGVR